MSRSAKGEPEADRQIRAAWHASRVGVAAIIFFSLFINLLRFATPVYMFQLFDRVLNSRSMETLAMLTLIVLAAVLAASGLDVVRRSMLWQLGAWIERRFGPSLFATAAAKRNDPAVQTPTLALRDLSTIRAFVSGPSMLACLDLPWAPVAMAIVFLFHPLLGVITAVLAVAILVLGLVHDFITQGSLQASNRASTAAQGYAAAAERTAETVGALSMAANLAARWHRTNADRLDESVRGGFRSVSVLSAMRFLRECMQIAALGVGVWLVLDDQATLGGVIAAGILMRWVIGSIEGASRSWRSVLATRRAFQRIKIQFAAAATSTSSSLPVDKNGPLVIEKLTFRYPDAPELLFRNIDLNIGAGEILCVVGPTAAGKTTLCRLLTGVTRPRSGHIRLGDVDIDKLPPADLARHVGYLPQDIWLFKGTVRDNIARMGDGQIDAVVDAAKLAGIHERILRLPSGYDTEFAENAPGMSAGERKGIALARAFYGRPRLIVLDEPDANLDANAQKALVTALEGLKGGGSTIVVTAQSRTLSKHADKVLIVGGGKAQLMAGEQPGRNVPQSPERSAADRTSGAADVLPSS